METVGGITRRGVIRTAAALGLTGTLAGCGLFNSKVSYRFRMTVDAGMTPQVAAYSSVYEIVVEKNNDPIKLAEERGGGSAMLGQALILALSDGPVFVLMRKAESTDGLQWEVTKALKPEIEHEEFSAFLAAARSLRSSGTKADLPRADWPMMVRFRDNNDPQTIEQVNPDAIGVKRIWLETTRDPISTGVEKKLPPWFVSLYKKGGTFSGNTSHVVSTNKLRDNLGPDSFGQINIR